jgi:micrococcal nuclease
MLSVAAAKYPQVHELFGAVISRTRCNYLAPRSSILVVATHLACIMPRVSHFLLSLFLLSCASAALAAQPPSAPTRATVISVTDGDTIIVARDGTPEKVRLVDIDSPEKSQPFGRVAKRALSDLVYMREVTITRHGRDRYGRTLATVTRKDGKNVNAELVRAGIAWVYKTAPPDSLYKGLESEARKSRRGLWSQPTAIAPWEFRPKKKLRTRERNDADGLIRELLREPIPQSTKSTKSH